MQSCSVFKILKCYVTCFLKNRCNRGLIQPYACIMVFRCCERGGLRQKAVFIQSNQQAKQRGRNRRSSNNRNCHTHWMQSSQRKLWSKIKGRKWKKVITWNPLSGWIHICKKQLILIISGKRQLRPFNKNVEREGKKMKTIGRSLERQYAKNMELPVKARTQSAE